MTDPLARVIDSIAFVAAVRTAFLIVEDKADPDRRFFLPLKINISRACTGLAFQIEPHVLPSSIETSRVSWDKRPVTITAAEALTALTPDDDIDDAKELAEVMLPLLPLFQGAATKMSSGGSSGRSGERRERREWTEWTEWRQWKKWKEWNEWREWKKWKQRKKWKKGRMEEGLGPT